MSYPVGRRVRVDAREHDGHHRTPGYLKGKVGTVEREHAPFRNPETRAYGDDGLPSRTLYLVGFAQRDVWPGYRGMPDDTIHVDLFEHWLEAVE